MRFFVGTKQFVGQWEPMKQYPKPLAESHGGIIAEQYLFMTGGFDSGYGQTTSDTYRLDLTDPDAVFEKQDSYPRARGITHGASVIVGNKFYICGGYLGMCAEQATTATWFLVATVGFLESREMCFGGWRQRPSLPCFEL